LGARREDWAGVEAGLALAIVAVLVLGSVAIIGRAPAASTRTTVSGASGRRGRGGAGSGSAAGTGTGTGTNGPAAPGTTATSPSNAPAGPTATPPPTSAPRATTTAPPTHITVAPVLAGYPTTPPAPICDNRSVLNGPAAPAAGWIRVTPGQNLNDVTQAAPAGSTFWLAPGTFTLGSDQFGQVIPKDGDVYIGAPGAVVDGGGLNRYAFTQTARSVTIRNLTVQNFVAPRDEGVVNHDSGAAWIVRGNTFQNNGGAAMMVGPGDVVTYNCLRNNGQYGFNAFAAAGNHNITFDHNEVAGNNTANWEKQVPGCGCTGAGKFWNVIGAVVTNNWIHNNHGPGLFADTDNVGFDIEHNYIADNDGEGIIYEISYNARIAGNTLIRNAIAYGQAANTADSFPIPAIYISESGGDKRVFGGVYSTLAITGNFLKDNWGGVTLWENADRFCGSPSNTSTTYCTLGGAATLATCVAGTIASAPYVTDCRWRTQNVLVTDNDFYLNRAAIGCTTQASCGQQAVLSQVGTSPSWSPYKGDTVQQAITFAQNNHFSANRYHGNWRFTGFETGRTLSLSAWDAAPYHQDTQSSLAAS
jgi:hypothetical protein